MQKMIKITTSNEVSVLDFPVNDSENCTQKLIGFYQAIGCNFIEIVRPQYIPSHIIDSQRLVMVVDEDGLMNKKDINLIGSLFYGTAKHGSPILGDILVVTEEWTPGGPDLVGFDEERAETFAKSIQNLIDYARSI